MIKTVIRCPDDTVLAFDENGNMLPLYLGNFSTVKARVEKDSTRETVFTNYNTASPLPSELMLEAR